MRRFGTNLQCAHRSNCTEAEHLFRHLGRPSENFETIKEILPLFMFRISHELDKLSIRL